MGYPLKIAPLTINLYYRIYARVLVEIDLARPVPERIFVTKKELFEFFVDIEFRTLPKFYNFCRIIGHELRLYRRRGAGENTRYALPELLETREAYNFII